MGNVGRRLKWSRSKALLDLASCTRECGSRRDAREDPGRNGDGVARHLRLCQPASAMDSAHLGALNQKIEAPGLVILGAVEQAGDA